jgi:hypothetical protein
VSSQLRKTTAATAAIALAPQRCESDAANFSDRTPEISPLGEACLVSQPRCRGRALNLAGRSLRPACGRGAAEQGLRPAFAADHPAPAPIRRARPRQSPSPVLALLIAVLIAPFETRLIGFARFKALRGLEGLDAKPHRRVGRDSIIRQKAELVGLGKVNAL